ncbi:MFS transporter [Amycolatopsis sp. NPDC059021]|uniref:MFS transporter n=1 Tax=Amycolatopsis sp. NPDC059021 TaxID=3346704 RepID=UPI00366E86C7
MRGPLGEPGFGRLWVAAFFAESAEWMLQVALPVHLFRTTGSATSTALSIVLGMLPMVLLSPLAGVVADRWDRRLVMCAVSVGQALVVLPLLSLSGAAVVYVVMAAQAGLAAAFEPARSALVPQLVGVGEVTAANGLMSVNGNVARLAGGWLGGALLGASGLGAVVTGYVAALALAVILLLKPFGRKENTPGAAVPEPMLRAWLDGLREVARHRRLRPVGAAVVLGSVAQGMFLVLFVVYVLDTLGGSEADAGLLRGVQAIGGLTAGLALATIARRIAPVALLGWGALAMGVLSAVIWNLAAVTTAIGVYAGLFMAVGAPAVLVGAGQLAEVQSVVPPERAGRVLSTVFAVVSAGLSAGALLTGALIPVVGSAALLDAQAGLYLLAGLIVLVAHRTSRRRWEYRPALLGGGRKAGLAGRPRPGRAAAGLRR